MGVGRGFRGGVDAPFVGKPPAIQRLAAQQAHRRDQNDNERVHTILPLSGVSAPPVSTNQTNRPPGRSPHQIFIRRWPFAAMPAAGRHRQGRPKGCKKRPRPGVPPGFARAGPLPKTKAFKRRRANGPGRRNSASAVPLRLPPFCRRPLCRARARHRARMRCPVTGAKRRCATKAARPVPAGCSQGIFLFRPASAFSAPGGSLCAGNWEKNVSCSKQLFVASLRCWLYFSPVASICQPFFVHFVIFFAAKLCKP